MYRVFHHTNSIFKVESVELHDILDLLFEPVEKYINIDFYAKQKIHIYLLIHFFVFFLVGLRCW
jgi:hypothetical protein